MWSRAATVSEQSASGDPAPTDAGPAPDNLNQENITMTKPTTSWRDLIKVHPAADLFPLLSSADLSDLTEDIKAHGLQYAVRTWFDKYGKQWLIDGRNRLDALQILGYRFEFKETHGTAAHLIIYQPDSRKTVGVIQHRADEDPYAIAVSANIHRRHLTAEQKRELIGKLLRANPERSDRATAKLSQASDKTVAAVRDRLEASADIPHIQPTDRVDTGGRKRARKTANEAEKVATAEEQTEPVKDADRPASDVIDELERLTKSAELMEVSLDDVLRARALHKVGTTELCDAVKEGSITLDAAAAMLPSVPRVELSELPFDAALAQFRSWYAGLSTAEQGQVEAAMDAINEIPTSPQLEDAAE
jgi:hypothetical protein